MPKPEYLRGFITSLKLGVVRLQTNLSSKQTYIPDSPRLCEGNLGEQSFNYYK